MGRPRLILTALLLNVAVIISVHCGGSGTSTSNTSSPTSPTPTRVIALSGNLAFGNVQVGNTATATLTITNSGNATLTVSGITGPSAGIYSATWTSGTIPVGGSQAVTIGFAPTAAQTYSGTLTVNGDQTSGTNTIAISGTGLPTPTPTPTPTPSTTIQSNIDGTFEGWTGDTIFPLTNGQYWQQTSYSYLYHYAFRPKVVITKSGSLYILSVEGVSETIYVQQLQGVIKSQIDGTFEGWTGDTIFPLTNGQIWQQSSYAYTYHYAYRPEVLIYSSGGLQYKMKVDGVSATVAVKRIK